MNEKSSNVKSKVLILVLSFEYNEKQILSISFLQLKKVGIDTNSLKLSWKKSGIIVGAMS